ncbi:MAG: hypothetical protein OXU20_20280 [Myxococcales bacterium]|nr:hypothetical protein [Myxococcales bacterium]
MNDTLLEDAITNNVALCEAVLAAHGVRGATTGGWWCAQQRVPPYYSNLITRVPGDSRQLYEAIESVDLAAPWFIKDSFACLKLETRGFRSLFDAQWYGCAAGHLASPVAPRFERIGAGQALARWEETWQRTSPAPGMRIFPATILEDTGLEFYRLGDAGGAILKLSRGAVGISNVFPRDAELHREVVRLAASLHPGLAIVGYGNHDDVLPLGLRPLGPLRVWQRVGQNQ